MATYSFHPLILPSLILVFSLCYVIDVPASSFLGGSFLTPYTRCFRGPYDQTSDLRQHHAVNAQSIVVSSRAEHPSNDTNSALQANGTIRSYHLAPFSSSDTTPATSTKSVVIPGALSKAGGGPGGSGSTGVVGKCLVTATKTAEQKPGVVIRDGTGFWRMRSNRNLPTGSHDDRRTCCVKRFEDYKLGRRSS